MQNTSQPQTSQRDSANDPPALIPDDPTHSRTSSLAYQSDEDSDCEYEYLDMPAIKPQFPEDLVQQMFQRERALNLTDEERTETYQPCHDGRDGRLLARTVPQLLEDVKNVNAEMRAVCDQLQETHAALSRASKKLGVLKRKRPCVSDESEREHVRAASGQRPSVSGETSEVRNLEKQSQRQARRV